MSAGCSTVGPTYTTVSMLAHNFGQVLSTSSTSADASAAAERDVTTAPPLTLREQKRQMRKQMDATLLAMSSADLDAQSAALTQRILAHPTYQRATAVCLFLSMPTGEVRTDALLRDALAAGKRVFAPRIDPPAPKATSTPASSPSCPSCPTNVTLGAAPAAVAPLRMRMLRVYSCEDLASFQPNRWGIREPPETYRASRSADAEAAPAPTSAAPEDDRLREEALDCDALSLILCPGVAFDRQCRRLGHGKGYYDSYLERLQQARATRPAADQRKVHLIAIAFDRQVVERIPTGETDVTLDEVVTPTHHFKAAEGTL